MQTKQTTSVNGPAAKQLTLDRITKRFKGTVALHGISLTVHPGELISLLGPSGCGKTTTLRLIAGFDFPDEGSVRIDGADISHLPPNKRGLGMVFQNYSLFPHLTVAENIGFGLKMAGASRSHIQSEVKRMLAMIRLESFGDRLINQMSGGQQQRVALARAIVTNPSVLLLDEPLGALDKNLREGMQFEIRRLQQSLGITSVMVTHDQEEAMTMSDRIVVMNGGRIVQIGKPEDVYNYPRTRFVAEFLGTANIVKGRLESIDGKRLIFSLPKQNASLSGSACRISILCDETPTWIKPGNIAEIAIRPEKIRLGGSGDNTLQGVVQQHVFRGSQHSYRIDVPELGTTLTVSQFADFHHDDVHNANETVTLVLDEHAGVLLEPEDLALNEQAAGDGAELQQLKVA